MIRNISVTIRIMSANVKWNDSAGKSANGTRTAIMTAATAMGMTGTTAATDVTVMTTTTIDTARCVRHGGERPLVACYTKEIRDIDRRSRQGISFPLVQIFPHVLEQITPNLALP